MKFNDLKIGTRLVAGSSVVLALLLIAAVIGVSRIEHLRGKTQEVTHINDAEARLAMGKAVLDWRIGLGNVVTMTDAAGVKEETARVSQDMQRYADAQDKLAQKLAAPGPAAAEKKELLVHAEQTVAAAAPVVARILELGATGHNDEARILIEELRPLQKRWSGALDDIVRFEEQRNAQLLATVDREYHSALAGHLATMQDAPDALVRGSSRDVLDAAKNDNSIIGGAQLVCAGPECFLNVVAPRAMVEWKR